MSHVVRPLTAEARLRMTGGVPVRANFRRTGTGYSRNRIPLGESLDLLDREVAHLQHGSSRWDAEFVLMLEVRESDLRLDGQIRGNAKPSSHAAAVTFDAKCEPYLFATDHFDHWTDNVRAIALALEALRKVDRYGVTHASEQYTGFRALPPGIPMLGTRMTVDEAARFLIEQAEVRGEVGDLTQAQVHGQESDAVARVYRQAAKRLHPDFGGDEDEFKRLNEARDVLLGVSS